MLGANEAEAKAAACIQHVQLLVPSPAVQHLPKDGALSDQSSALASLTVGAVGHCTTYGPGTHSQRPALKSSLKAGWCISLQGCP